jgi:hypothetical protein
MFDAGWDVVRSMEDCGGMFATPKRGPKSTKKAHTGKKSSPKFKKITKRLRLGLGLARAYLYRRPPAGSAVSTGGAEPRC